MPMPRFGRPIHERITEKLRKGDFRCENRAKAVQKSLRSRKYSVSICLEGQQAYDMNSAPISSPIPQHDARFRCHHRSGYRAGRHPFIPWHGRCGCAIWGNRLGDCCLNMFEYFPIWVCLKIGINRVYSQWNSHLIGIMISKTIGFRGTLFSDTPIYSHFFVLFKAPPKKHRIPSAIGRCRHDRLEDVTTLGRPGGAPTVFLSVLCRKGSSDRSDKEVALRHIETANFSMSRRCKPLKTYKMGPPR